MRGKSIPDSVLVNPTPEQFDAALRAHVREHLGNSLADFDDLQITLDTLEGPHGYRVWQAFRYTEPTQSRCRAVGVAWWRDPAGTLYARFVKYARCELGYEMRYRPFTPWCAVFQERAQQLHAARTKRFQQLLARRLAGAPDATYRRGTSREGHWPFDFAQGRLVGATADAILVADNEWRPKTGAVLLRDAQGIYHFEKVPKSYVDPTSARYRRLGTPTARVLAALDAVFKNAIAGK